MPSNMSESVCSLKFAQRVRSVELSSSSSRKHENSSTSSSPTHDSVEVFLLLWFIHDQLLNKGGVNCVM